MIKPKILITNDDGISSEGIFALWEAMDEIGKTFVAAPSTEQSASSHSLTLSHPLRVKTLKRKDGFEGWSIDGTPVDCVKIAIRSLMKESPDILISGINHGSNSSINVIYSGTMSAAVEASLEGIPSIGFSLLDYSHNANFKEAEIYVRKITQSILKNGMQKGVCLNVNIPKIRKNEPIKGIKVCRQANGNWEEVFEKKVDAKAINHYWLKGKFVNYDKGSDTDEWALANHFVSVVPVQCDLTAYPQISSLNKILSDE